MVATGNGPSGPYEATFRFQTDILMKELSFPESFDLIVLADAEGHPLYQEAPTRQRWLHLLRWAEQTFRDSSAAETNGPRVQNLTSLFRKDADPN